MALRCNICSQEIEEKDLGAHLESQQHADNRAKLGKKIEGGLGVSIVGKWLESTRE